MASKTTRLQITMGPSKWDLSLALFDNWPPGMPTPRLVKFQTSVEETWNVQVFSVERDEGVVGINGWRIKGEATLDGTNRGAECEAFYNEVKRNGELTLIFT